MIEFKVKTELLADETRVVSVAGELDMYTAPEFEREVRDAVDNGRAPLVVDLSRCVFLDSTALEILLNANKRLGEGTQRLVLVSPERSIARIFEITGLDRVFTIVSTRASALNGAARV